MNLRGLFALLAGIALFSTIEVASKLMQTGGGNRAGQYPFWRAFFRFFIAGLVLLGPAFRYLNSRDIQLVRRDLLALIGLGLFGVTLMSSLYHLSITFLPANIAALLFSCNPVFVVLFAPLLLPEKITLRKSGAVLLCLTGIGVLAFGCADEISMTGVLLMLAAIVIFAFYTLFFKKMIPHCGALPVSAFAALIGGLFILPIALEFEGIPLAAYGAADWMGVTYLSLIGTALAYFLYIYGIGHIEAGIGSMAFFLKPFLAAFFAWMVLGEALSTPEVVGGSIILAGMLVALLPMKNRKPTPMD